MTATKEIVQFVYGPHDGEDQTLIDAPDTVFKSFTPDDKRIATECPNKHWIAYVRRPGTHYFEADDLRVVQGII